jgi:hypothetical protein
MSQLFIINLLTCVLLVVFLWRTITNSAVKELWLHSCPPSFPHCSLGGNQMLCHTHTQAPCGDSPVDRKRGHEPRAKENSANSHVSEFGRGSFGHSQALKWLESQLTTWLWPPYRPFFGLLRAKTCSENTPDFWATETEWDNTCRLF